MSVSQFNPNDEQSLKLYPAKPQKVYLFGTCLVDMFYPEAGMAGVLLLEHAGIEVLFPQAQTCCGQPAYTSGYQQEARDVALAQMALFDEDYPILVPSGSCGGMIRWHYPWLFIGTEHEAVVADFSARVYELTEFLVHVGDVQLEDKGQPQTMALHTSCSSRREMKTTDAGKALLGKLANVTVLEAHKASECCGFGGAFSVRHPDISNAMVADKLTHLKNTGAESFISSDCGCLMNIKGAAEKATAAEGMERGEHLLSFVARRAGLGEI